MQCVDERYRDRAAGLAMRGLRGERNACVVAGLQ